MGPALLWPLELFGELFDATLDIPLEGVSSLVLRNDAKHLPQTLKALARVAGLAECSLRGLVLGREVSRHDSAPQKPAPYVALVRLPRRGLFYVTGAGLLRYAMGACFPP